MDTSEENKNEEQNEIEKYTDAKYKHILISGGNGFLGSHVIDTLLLNDNYVETAKSFMDIKKESPVFDIKFGYIDGNIITIQQLESISKLPSREVLIGQFLSVLNQPIIKFLYAAKSIPSSLVNVLNNLKDKK